MKTLLNIGVLLVSLGAFASSNKPDIYQYWFDNKVDSRLENTKVYDAQSNSILINTDGLSEGGHSLNIRMADENRRWGQTTSIAFCIPWASDASSSVAGGYRIFFNGKVINEEQGPVPDPSYFERTFSLPEDYDLSFVNSREFSLLSGNRMRMKSKGGYFFAVQLLSAREDKKEWGAPLYYEFPNANDEGEKIKETQTEINNNYPVAPFDIWMDKVGLCGFHAYKFRNEYSDHLFMEPSQDCTVRIYYLNDDGTMYPYPLPEEKLTNGESKQVYTAYTDRDLLAVFYDTPKNKYNDQDGLRVRFMLEDRKVPDPSIHLDNDTWKLSIKCPDPRATVFYTLDNSEPNRNSEKFTNETNVVLEKFTRVLAYAVLDGFEDSNIVQQDYKDSKLQIPVPTLKYVDSPGKNTFRLTNRVDGVTIYYTLGDEDVTDDQIRNVYEGEILTLEDGMTIHAYCEKAGLTKSDILDEIIVLDNYVTPMPTEGGRLEDDGSYKMSISIPWTSDGSIKATYRVVPGILPESDEGENIDIPWMEYNPENPYFYVQGNHTVQVYGEFEGKARSAINNIHTDWIPAKQPIVDYKNYVLKFRTETPGAIVKFWDGYASSDVEPEIYSAEKYPEGIDVNRKYVIEAYVEAEGFADSNHIVFYPDNYNLSSPSIRYLDDDEDDGYLHIMYEDPEAWLNIDVQPYQQLEEKGKNHYRFDPKYNTIVKVYAERNGYNNSSTVTMEPQYIPEIEVDGYMAYIHTGGWSADVYYTTDGTEPTRESTKFKGDWIEVGPCVINAVAFYYHGIPGKAEPVRVMDQAMNPQIQFNFSQVKKEDGSIEEIKKIRFSCDTQGAKIWYSLDDVLNDKNKIEYKWDELDVSDVRNVYAYSEAPDFRNSNTVSFDMRDAYLSAPSIRVEDDCVVIEHGDPSVTIVPKFYIDSREVPYYPADADKSYVHDEETNRYTVKVVPNMIVDANVEKWGYISSDDNSISSWMSKPEINVDGYYVWVNNYYDETYYTLDGTTPTKQSKLYQGRFNTDPCTVRVVSFSDGSIPVEADPVQVLPMVETPSVVYAFDRATDKRHVKLRCATPDAKIYYSLDRGLSDTSRKLYDAAADTLDVTDKSYIYLYAEKDGFRRSEEYFQYINDAYLNIPSIQVDGLSVVISSDDPAVTIVPVFYKGTAANAYVPEDLAYVHEGDVNKITATVDFNTTVKAHTERAGYYASSDNEANPLEKPTVIVNDYNVYIDYPYWGEVFYTTDGSVPSQLSIPYVGSFDSQACTIRAAAFADGYIPSLSESAKVMDPAAMPEIDIDNGFAKLNSATPGAVIWYSLDQGIGAGTRKLYDPAELPDGIDISNVNTIYSYAEADGYRQSETLNFYKGEFTLEAPSLEYANGYVTAEHDDDEVVIRFADGDGNALQAEADNARKVKAEYNKTVVAYAYRKGWVNSRSVQVKHVDAPTITANLFDISIKGKSGQTLRYTTDGSQPTTSSQEYTAPFHVTSSCTVRAAAFVDDQIPSEATAVSVNYRKSNAPAVASYDGRYLTLSAENGSTIKYLIGSTGSVENTGVVANGKIDVEGLKTVRAMAQRSDADDSEVFSFTPEYYANESDVYTSKAGVLKNAFEWCSDLSDFSSLAVHGVMLGSAEEDNGDYEFLRSLPNLRHLDLSKVTDENVPAGALASKQLVSVTLPETLKSTGEFVFGEDNSTLCAVELPASGFAPVHLLDGVKNPNLLLYAKSTNYVSDLIAATDGVVKNVVVLGSVNNRAEGVTLTHADPFYASREFNAQKINFTREFTKQTQIGGFGSGWETMVVPFDVQTIACGTKTLKPFGDAVTDRGECPFWLFEAGENDWIPSGSIMANTPYLLAMPNNPLYAEEFVVNGNVTFSANNVTVAVTPDEEDMTFAFGTGKYIAGNYSLIDKDDSMLAINDEVFNYRNTDFQPGGLFVAGMKDVVPFECYVLSQSVSAMPVFDQSSIDEIMDEYGTHVWGENYCIFIRSAISMKVRIYDSVGQLIRSVDVKAGETVQVNDITPGIYFVGSNKILVKG